MREALFAPELVDKAESAQLRRVEVGQGELDELEREPLEDVWGGRGGRLWHLRVYGVFLSCAAVLFGSASSGVLGRRRSPDAQSYAASGCGVLDYKGLRVAPETSDGAA